MHGNVDISKLSANIVSRVTILLNLMQIFQQVEQKLHVNSLAFPAFSSHEEQAIVQ